MGWADQIVNIRNMPAVDYVKEKQGPMVKIAHRENYDLLMDELEHILESQSDKIKKDKGLHAFNDQILNTKMKVFKKSGVEFDLKLCKAFVKDINSIGTRAMRDFPLLSLVEDIFSNHLAGVKPERK